MRIFSSFEKAKSYSIVIRHLGLLNFEFYLKIMVNIIQDIFIFAGIISQNYLLYVLLMIQLKILKKVQNVKKCHKFDCSYLRSLYTEKDRICGKILSITYKFKEHKVLLSLCTDDMKGAIIIIFITLWQVKFYICMMKRWKHSRILLNFRF